MKRFVAVATVALVTSMSLVGCSAGNSVVPNSHVTIAEVGGFETLNADVTQAGAKFADDLAALTMQSFYELDKNGNLVENKNFGTVEVTKQEPFTVTYTLGKFAVWSDGSNLDATDLALAVIAAQNPDFKSSSSATSLANAEIVGTPKIGQKTLSLKFTQPISDWKTALTVAVPAHVVGKAAGIGGNVSAVRAGIVDAIVGNNADELSKLAVAYSDAFKPTASVENFVTNGAYSVKSVSAEEVVLKAQRDFAGEHTPIAETVKLVSYPDNAAAFKAAGSGEADVFLPQPSLTEPQSDLVSQAGALGSKTVNVLAPSSNYAEQFVMNMGSGAFADTSYSNPSIGPALRSAFMELVPKARAIDFASLTQTVTRADSFVFSAGSKNYSAATSSNGSTNYMIQDAEKASNLISALKLGYTPTVRVLFDTDNPAAVAEWTLLSDNASDAGFKLRNISSSDPSDHLNGGNYEVYLGALPLLGVGDGSVQQLTTGPARMPLELFNGLTAKVQSADEKGLSAALSTLDKALFDLGYGLPMYQLPTLVIANKRISGFGAHPFGQNAGWGYWTWHVSADKS